MYQTVGHPAPERRLGSVIVWGYIALVARRVALLTAWASLVVVSWGLFIGLYPAFLGLRLIFSWLWVTMSHAAHTPGVSHQHQHVWPTVLSAFKRH